jgi:hypothetical protein
MTRRRPGGRTTRRLVVLAAVAWSGVLLGLAAPAAAHPLGDFTVNTHVGIRVEPAAVALDVVVDIAEVPALRAFPALRGGSGRRVPDAEQRAYRDRLCPALLEAVAVRLGGRPVELELVGSALSFPPGDAGLATARLECALRSTGDLRVVGQQVVVTDSMAVRPVGWREITAVGDGVELARSTVPSRSPSKVLRSYPDDLLDAPLDHREARLSVVAGDGVVTGRTAGTVPDVRPALVPSTLASGLTDLVGTKELSIGAGLAAVALAAVLGSLHAFAPGHGKTLMAAYLVGRGGTLRQAALIGASVTLTHTAGVLVLGLLVSVAVVGAPEELYPWLSVVSGVLLVAIGVTLLRDGWRRREDDGPTTATATATTTATATGTGTGTSTGRGTSPPPVAPATRSGCPAGPGMSARPPSSCSTSRHARTLRLFRRSRRAGGGPLAAGACWPSASSGAWCRARPPWWSCSAGSRSVERGSGWCSSWPTGSAWRSHSSAPGCCWCEPATSPSGGPWRRPGRAGPPTACGGSSARCRWPRRDSSWRSASASPGRR